MPPMYVEVLVSHAINACTYVPYIVGGDASDVNVTLLIWQGRGQIHAADMHALLPVFICVHACMAGACAYSYLQKECPIWGSGAGD